MRNVLASLASASKKGGRGKTGVAIGAFNAQGIETVLGILDAAKKQQAPVIIQVSEATLEIYGWETEIGMIVAAAHEWKDVPVVLHLDHGKSIEHIERAIALGFSSVMVDASRFPFRHNVTMTKKIIETARRAGVVVQAELGRIPGKEEWVTAQADDTFLTDPAEAEKFVKATGIETLAVSVGTAHGPWKLLRKPIKIHQERLAEISRRTDIPIVLHGASGIPASDIQQAIANGVRIINIDSDLRKVFTDTLRKTLASNPSEVDPRTLFFPSRRALSEKVEEKIRIFGTSGLSALVISNEKKNAGGRRLRSKTPSSTRRRPATAPKGSL